MTATDHSIWSLVMEASLLVKGVMLTLLLASVASWFLIAQRGVPVILEEDSDAGQAYDDAVARLLGEEREHRFMTAQKKGFFSRMFKGG